MPKQEPPHAIMITVVGTGAQADQQARALRGIEGVEIERLAAATEDELLENLSQAGTPTPWRSLHPCRISRTPSSAR